jgi:gluconolactonase
MDKPEDMTILADDLWFPEGPLACADGSVLLVEGLRGTITRVGPDREKTIVARPGGGPNGMAVGPDGALYVCNNGGLAYEMRDGRPMPTGPAADYAGGRIERIDPATGAVRVLYDRCGETRLSSPNDIVFDAEGGFYFTDLGKSLGGVRQPGGVFYASIDGNSIWPIAHPAPSMPNGCGLSPDGRTLYVSETRTARLLAFELSAPGRVRGRTDTPDAYGARSLCLLPPPAKFDSHAVDADGNICVATLETGHISVISPGGDLLRQVPFPDPWVTNICFGGAGLRTAFITLSQSGRLVSMPWPDAGLRLNFNN